MYEERAQQEAPAPRAISSYTPELEQPSSSDPYPMVRDFMDTKLVRLQVDTPVYDAIEILLQKRITGAAVVDADDVLVGILSEKDCLRTLLQGAYDGLPGGRVCDYMTQEVQTIGSATDIMSVVQVFMNNAFRRLLVVDEGRLVGQITRRDLLRTIQEIVRTRKRGSVH